MPKIKSDSIRSDVNKKFKKEVVFKGDDSRFNIERIPTGVLSFDILFLMVVFLLVDG